MGNTGDIIDSATHIGHLGMDLIYGAPISYRLPWAATMGNHDDKADLNRSQVMAYIVGMNWGTYGKSEIGTVNDSVSYGNYYLNVFKNNSDGKPAFRTWHLDSDATTPEQESITEGQAAWYHSTSKALEDKQGRVPGLMFFHVPLKEYDTAVKAPGAKISGHYNEGVCYQPGDGGLFKALQDRKDVKATFVGHDHTND